MSYTLANKLCCDDATEGFSLVPLACDFSFFFLVFLFSLRIVYLYTPSRPVAVSKTIY